MPSEARGAARASLASLALPALLLAAAAALRLQNAWTDLDTLSKTTVPDDSYYYFGVAKHLALGNPPSIDGVHPTNGYHPLWVGAVLLPLYWLFPASDLQAPIHAALTAGALFDVVAAFLLYRIARAIGVALVPSLFALALYAFNPYAVALATSGLESPLALCLTLLVVLLFLTRTPSAPRGDGRPLPAFVVGGVCGLAVLARTDSLILIGVLAVTRLWPSLRARLPVRRSKAVSLPPPADVRYYLLAGAAAALVVAPWLVYSFVTTGTIVQSSSLALAILIERFPEIWGYERAPFLLRMERLWASVEEGARMVSRFAGIGATATWATLFASVAALAGATGAAGRASMTKVRRACPLFVALGIMFLAHTAARKVFREWYTPPFIAGFALLVALALDHLLRAVRHRTSVLAAVAVLGVLLLGAETTRWHEEGLFGFARVTEVRPNPDIHEGHTDCGVMAYYQGGIANLDGVVNQGALSALRSGHMLDYIRSEGFDRVYATDHYHSAVFFGPRYREKVRRQPGDPRAITLVSADAKDELVRITGKAIALGSVEGWEFLSDGWLWETQPHADRAPMSVGRSSEIIFLPKGAAPSGSTVDVMLSSSLPGPDRTATVTARVGDGARISLRVGATPQWYSIPVEAREGRQRLRLEYANPEPLRPQNHPTWWRSLNGSPLTTVRAHRLRFTRTLPLPPEGPALTKPVSDAFFLEGFLPVERRGRNAGVWAIDRKAEVRFLWPRDPHDALLTIAAGPPPRGSDGADQTLHLTLNGADIGSVRLRESAIESHEIAVPAGALRRGENRLSFAADRLSPPDDRGVVRAMYLQSLSLE